MFTHLKPLNDRVLIKRDKPTQKTESGIYVPEGSQEKPQTGTVIAVAKAVKSVKPGNIVYFGKYAAVQCDDEHILLKEEELYGVVND